MTFTTSKNILAAFDPIGHKPPLPPIDIQPRKPITQPGNKSFLELQAEEEEAAERIKRGDRIWAEVDQIARSTNVSTPLPTCEPNPPVAKSASELEPVSLPMAGVTVRDLYREAVERNYQAAQGAIPIDDLTLARIAEIEAALAAEVGG